MARLRLSQVDLWQKHADAVVNVIRRAADLMIANGDQGLEAELNRRLLLYMHDATRALELQGSFVPSTYPVLEAINQPTPNTKGSSSEAKRPDVQWGYRDSQVMDPREAIRTFHIECKRIGTSTLDPLYVKKGVRRFIDEEWRYGKDVSDGVMIGYVEGRGPDAALLGVNATSTAEGIPHVVETSRDGARRELDHVLTRSFEKSPFSLHHIWIDTRTSRCTAPSESLRESLPGGNEKPE